jgi:hypothetical protein
MCPKGKFKCIVKHTKNLKLVTHVGESYECNCELVMAIVVTKISTRLVTDTKASTEVTVADSTPSSSYEIMEATLLNLITILPMKLPEPSFRATGFPVMPKSVLLPEFAKPIVLIPGRDAAPQLAEFAESNLISDLRDTFQWSNLKIRAIDELIRDTNPFCVTKGGIEFEHVYMLRRSFPDVHRSLVECGQQAMAKGNVDRLYKLLKEAVGPSIAAKETIQSPTFVGANVRQFTIDDLIVRWTLSRMLVLTKKSGRKIELTYTLPEKRAQMFGLPPSVTNAGIMFYSVDELLRLSIGNRFGKILKKLPKQFRELLSSRSLPNNLSGVDYLFTVKAPLVSPKQGEPSIINYDGKIASVRHIVAEAIFKMRGRNITRMAVAWHPSFMITIMLDGADAHVLLDSSARGSSIAPTYHSPKRVKNMYSGDTIAYGGFAFKQLARTLGYIGAHLDALK